MDDLVWLRHPETGGVNQFAAGGLEMWIARGWEACEPPPQTDDHLRDPITATESAADPTPSGQPTPEADSSASTPTPETSSPRTRRGITSQE